MGKEYSPLKMVRWLLREGKLPDAPKQVQLIISDLCNQDCSFCAYRWSGYSSNEQFVGSSDLAKYGHNNPVRFIPTDRALRLVDEIANLGCLAIQFTGGGEPTVHTDHELIFTRCLDRDMKAALVSNGVRWSRRLINDILPRFAWVRVSVDAGNEHTYAKIRRTPTHNWGLVWGHIGELAAAIRRKSSECLLGVGYVVTPENWHEIESCVNMAKISGARNIRVSAAFSPDGAEPYKAEYDRIRMDIHAARKKYEDGNFSVHDLFGERFDDLVDGPPDYKTCSYQHYTTYIGGNLKPYRCCVLAYNSRGEIAGADLSSATFDSFWKSRERIEDFESFDARGCERCQFNPKNRAMAYLLDKKPAKHEEFP